MGECLFLISLLNGMMTSLDAIRIWQKRHMIVTVYMVWCVTAAAAVTAVSDTATVLDALTSATAVALAGTYGLCNYCSCFCQYSAFITGTPFLLPLLCSMLLLL